MTRHEGRKDMKRKRNRKYMKVREGKMGNKLKGLEK